MNTNFQMQGRYRGSDLQIGDLVMVDEEPAARFNRRFKAEVSQIDGDTITAQIYAIHDLEEGGRILGSAERENPGDMLSFDARYVFRVARLDGEDI